MRKRSFLRPFSRSSTAGENAPTTVYTDAEQEAYAAAAREMALRIGANDKPVLVGPWQGCVSEELLYWIPFVRWLLEWGAIDPSRVWAISSGGARHWYGDVAGHYLELRDLYKPGNPPESGVSRFMEGGSNGQDQDDIPQSDLEIVERAMTDAGVDDIELVHPSHIFHIFKPYREARLPPSYVARLTRHRPLQTDRSGGAFAELPDDFIAVAFHGTGSFPRVDRNRKFVGELVRRLSQDAHVVVIDPLPGAADDQGFHVEASSRVYVPDAVFDLDAQTAIVSRARVLVGTHGGFSYLGALSGTSVIGLYSDPAFSLQHLALAQQVLRGDGYGNLSVTHVECIESLLSLPAVVDQGTGRR
ncbi:MAG: hypothetical protein WB783_01020 [Arenicellales bacterium]